MNEFLPILLVVIASFAVAALQANSFSPIESRWILGSFGAHVAGAFAQVWFTHAMYGAGDMTVYAQTGDGLAALMRYDPGQFIPEVVKLLFHQEAKLPIEIIGVGTSTGTMSAVAGFLILVTGGSIYTASCCVAVGAHFGQVALYRGLRMALPDAPLKRVLFSALLVPSMVFWSSALVKEGVATLGLGYAFYGIQRVLRGQKLAPAPALALGTVIIGITKPYILLALLAGTTAAFIFNAPKHRQVLNRPLNIIVGAVVGLAGTAVILSLFPNYNPDAVAEEAARLQEVGQIVTGTSTYTIGDPTQRSLAGQLAFAPLALVTALFRPFIFEARSAQIFVNALETTAVLVLLIRVLYRRGLPSLWSAVVSQPMHVFSLTYMLLFGVGIGLTTTNLGTLSRYRMPLIPFLWSFVLVLGADAAAGSRAPTLARAPSPGGPIPRRVHARAPALPGRTR
jgi:hypothetical protein